MHAVLLDTDIVSEILKGRNPVVNHHAFAYLQVHGSFCFSAITHYQVLRGLREKNAQVQLAAFASFSARSLVLPVSDLVLNRAADLWVLARTGGFPCEDGDLFVAATGLETNRVVVTGNTAHFSWVPGLQLANWRIP